MPPIYIKIVIINFNLWTMQKLYSTYFANSSRKSTLSFKKISTVTHSHFSWTYEKETRDIYITVEIYVFTFQTSLPSKYSPRIPDEVFVFICHYAIAILTTKTNFDLNIDAPHFKMSSQTPSHPARRENWFFVLYSSGGAKLREKQASLCLAFSVKGMSF